MKLKDYSVSFVMMFVSAITACLFHLFESVYVSCFGGGAYLACVTFWRLSFVQGKGYSVDRHFAALFLGFLTLMLPFYALTFSNSLTSMAFSLSWALAVLLFYLCFKFRHWAVYAVAVALWVAFILFAVPEWVSYVQELYRNGYSPS